MLVYYGVPLYWHAGRFARCDSLLTPVRSASCVAEREFFERLPFPALPFSDGLPVPY